MTPETKRPVWGLWGNQAAVERMERAVRNGPRHAYIVSGAPSVGKTMLASAFASALICPERGEDGGSCGQCSTCRRALKGVHPDVMTFDLAYQIARDESKSKNTTLNIATIRDISRHVSLRPVEASWRIVIVDDVETMQETAQEAFLKTLEEPPSYAVILLLTTDAELLLPTILSRCSLVTMTPAPNAVVAQALESSGANSDDAKTLAIASRGSVGLALTAHANQAVRTELLDSVEKASSWIAGSEYDRVVESIRLADAYGDARSVVIDQLLAVEIAWRELVRQLAGTAEPSTHPVVSRNRLASLNDGYRALVAVAQCLRDLDGNVRPRAALESMVLRWPPVLPGAES